MKKSLYVILNRNCNLACSYCFQRQSGARENVPVNMDNVEKLVLYIKGMDDLRDITVMGGEALLAPEALLRLFEAAREANVLMSIITNGTVYLPWLKEMRGTLNQVQFSIDGPESIHDRRRVKVDGTGSYRKVMENLWLYKADDVPVTVHGVIPLDSWRESIDAIPRLIVDLPPHVPIAMEIENGNAVLARRKIKAARYFYRRMRSWDKRMSNRVSNLNHRCDLGFSPCSAGVGFMTFDVQDGKFYGCHEAVGVPGEVCGDIDSDPMFTPGAMERNLGRHDGFAYRYAGLPRLVSEFLKYILPLNYCWYNALLETGDEKTVSRYSLYVAWMNFRNINRNQEAVVGRKLWFFAKRMLERWKPCEGCTDFCCSACPYLGKDGCTTMCVACKLFLCASALERLPVLARWRLKRAQFKAFRLGMSTRTNDGWIA